MPEQADKQSSGAAGATDRQTLPNAIHNVISLKILHGLLERWDVDALRSRHGTRWRLWDIVIGIVAFTLGFALSPWHQERLPAWYYLLLVGGVYGVFLAACNRLCGVPDPEERATTYELVSACMLAVLVAYVMLSLTAALILVRAYGRYITFTILTYSFFGALLPRYWLMHLFALRPLNVVLYGAGRAGKACLERIASCPRLRAQGFLDANPELHGKDQFGIPVLGSVQDLERGTARDVPVNVVVICVGSSLLEENAAALLRLPLRGIEVLTMGAFVEQHFRLVPLDYDSPHWFASARSVPGNAPIFAAKRLLDLGVAIPGLLLSLPLWALVAILVKLDNPGPALFRQIRVGRFGRTFEIIKFRSMRLDAEKDGPQWAKRNDPRVTRLGRFLRLSRLDELPQLWNVLKGDMSLVGPRPERPEFVRELAAEIPFYAQRHLVPPGLTGYAQISYRYGSSKDDAIRKLEFDLYYSRHLSFRFDCEILVKTIPLLMKGSR